MFVCQGQSSERRGKEKAYVVLFVSRARVHNVCNANSRSHEMILLIRAYVLAFEW